MELIGEAEMEFQDVTQIIGRVSLKSGFSDDPGTTYNTNNATFNSEYSGELHENDDEGFDHGRNPSTHMAFSSDFEFEQMMAQAKRNYQDPFSMFNKGDWIATTTETQGELEVEDGGRERSGKIEPGLCDDPCSCPKTRYSLPPTPEPSDHTFENLNENRRSFCKQIFPKNLGHVLTDKILLEVLIKNQKGDFEMSLPGNQIYPGFLSRRLSDADIPTINSVLLEVRGITKLNFCYNEITDKGIEKLAPVIQECGNIIDLDLMHNNITAAGILTLVQALMYRGPLHSLKLTGMKIGEEGMKALVCLVLSGRCPHELDVGECDLNTKGFQGLCSALHAIETDIDYPDFLLLENNLPMDLVLLKNMKVDFNEEVAQASILHKRISFPTLVRIKDDPVAEKLLPAKLGGGGGGGGGDEDEPSTDINVEVFESFSATILQGLFDLRHRFTEDDLENEKVGGGGSSELQVLPYVDAGGNLPDVETIIDNFHKLRAGEKLQTPRAEGAEGDEDGEDLESSAFLSRSLYCLDVVDEEIMLMESSEDEPSDMDVNESVMITSHDAPHPDHASDSFSAQAAATFVLKEVVQTAAKAAGTSSYTDSTDITQLVLLTVLDTIELIGSGTNLSEDDCERILEDAMEKVYELIFPSIPPSCQVAKEEIQAFLRVLFAASQGTLKQLLENPFITEALRFHGTIACQGKGPISHQGSPRRALRSQGGATMTESQIRHIATSFISGIIKEAAREVGSERSWLGAQEGGNDLKATEKRVETAVASFFEAAAGIASTTIADARRTEDINQTFVTATDQFVLSLFDDVHKLVCETDMKIASSEESNSVQSQITYKFVSRPTRLNFNRPLFGSNSHILAAKMGDLLSSSKGIAAIHLQKWGLEENGMIAFMEPLLRHNNTSLVLLDLACNNLGADGIKLLSIYISKNKNLRHLILNNNGFRDAGLAHLNEVLPQSSLVSLDISNTRTTPRQLDPLLTLIPETQIRTLFLWGNHFGTETWNIMKTLYNQRVLSLGSTDVILQQAGTEKMIVKNMQIRDMNEYYGVPAVVDIGLRLSPSYIDNMAQHKNRILST